MSWKPDTKTLLTNAGIRATRGRVALLDTLISFARPISADELHAKVTMVDLVTVYRTLQSFVRAQIVREVRFKDTTLRYEMAESSHHHHHLVCTTCGIVDELPDCDMQSLEEEALKATQRFASIDEHSLEFFGTCRNCTK